MSVKNDIKDAIRGIVNTSDNEIYSVLCIVADVDLTNMTCDCVPVDTSKPNILDVNLIVKDAEGNVPKGSVIIPKIDSLVYVTMLNNETGYVAMFSEIEEQNLNGDNYEGLVMVKALVNKMNRLENEHNKILNVLKSTSIPLAASGTYPFAPLYAAINAISPITSQTDLENPTVKHGNGM